MDAEHNKTEAQIISEQLEFFARNLSGCGFAALAARDPYHFEWGSKVIRSPDHGKIDEYIAWAVAEPSVSTLSLIFPDVTSDRELDALIPLLRTNLLILYEHVDTEQNRCFRFRAQINEEQSFISGFGPFEYMPVTRRAPYTSIVMRVKQRPLYEWNFKEPESGIIHVADMNMKGLGDRKLWRMWNNSFLTTAGLLEKKPDQESAAKTTFVIPLARANEISI